MKRWKQQVVWSVILWLPVAALAAYQGDAAGEPALRVRVELSDGSRLIGTPAVSVIPLHTLFGEIETPLEHVDTLDFDDDHERVTVVLANGDRISGVHGLEALGLTTLFGDVMIDAALIRRIVLIKADK